MTGFVKNFEFIILILTLHPTEQIRIWKHKTHFKDFLFCSLSASTHIEHIRTGIKAYWKFFQKNLVNSVSFKLSFWCLNLCFVWLGFGFRLQVLEFFVFLKHFLSLVLCGKAAFLVLFDRDNVDNVLFGHLNTSSASSIGTNIFIKSVDCISGLKTMIIDYDWIINYTMMVCIFFDKKSLSTYSTRLL